MESAPQINMYSKRHFKTWEMFLSIIFLGTTPSGPREGAVRVMDGQVGETTRGLGSRSEGLSVFGGCGLRRTK